MGDGAERQANTVGSARVSLGERAGCPGMFSCTKCVPQTAEETSFRDAGGREIGQKKREIDLQDVNAS